MVFGLHNLGRIFVLKSILCLLVFVATSSISKSQALVPEKELLSHEGFEAYPWIQDRDLEEDLSFRAIILEASSKYNLDYRLLEAIIQVESNFDPNVTSPKGAIGLMQIRPASVGNPKAEELLDPYLNIMTGSRILRELLDSFDGELELALAAYNAGLSVVREYGGLPPYPETRAYVKKVLSQLEKGNRHKRS
ncbi:MAG: lytic transglycosylase domain-containing protein [Desulfatiglandales bacterium]